MFLINECEHAQNVKTGKLTDQRSLLIIIDTSFLSMSHREP